METNGKQQYINKEQGDRIKWLEEHYSIFNSEMGEVKSDVKWIKRLNFAILPILAGMIVSLIYIILEHVI